MWRAGPVGHDAKRYRGKVERRDVGGFFRTDVRLYVGDRHRTKAVEGLGWQVDSVRSVLGDGPLSPDDEQIARRLADRLPAHQP
jgi:hypothetical protein